MPTECIILPLQLSLIGSTYSMLIMKDTVNPRWSTVAPFSPGETNNHHPCLIQITAFPASESFGFALTLHPGSGLGARGKAET